VRRTARRGVRGLGRYSSSPDGSVQDHAGSRASCGSRDRRGLSRLAVDARQALGHDPLQGKPLTYMYLGLHVGNVFYGNVGSRQRLDFTVLGPAVNEASRIAAMCRSVDQPVLMSTAFAEVGNIRRRLVSVGRYALRGVSHPQELFTLNPEA
jgi:class 3 adenylate cyclase